jgi:hypothetical protein
VDFPDPLEREIGEELVERLTTVQGIRERVVKIQQKAAIRRVRHPPYEFAVPKFVGTRPQVIHAGLDGDRDSEGPLEVPNRGRYCFDALYRLARWQKESGREFRCLVETEVIAEPGRLEAPYGIAEEFELRGLRPDRSPDGRSDTVHELPAWQ